MFDAVAAGANVFLPVVLLERGQHGDGAGLPVVGWFFAETKPSGDSPGDSVRRSQNSWARF